MHGRKIDKGTGHIYAEYIRRGIRLDNHSFLKIITPTNKKAETEESRPVQAARDAQAKGWNLRSVDPG